MHYTLQGQAARIIVSLRRDLF